MADDAMFAPLPADKGTAGAVGAAVRPQLAPIVPVPAEAPSMHMAASQTRRAGGDVALSRCRWAACRIRRPRRIHRQGRQTRKGRAAHYLLPHNSGERHAWRAHGLPAPRPPYRLPELIANSTAPVIVMEGEKKADAVAALFPGCLGTTSMGGAQAAKHSDWLRLAGRNVIIWPDHDEPGRGYANDVAVLATAAGAASVAIVAVPADWPKGWDIADALPDGATPERLARLLAEATPWRPPAPQPPQPRDTVDDDAEIARLAKLSPIQCDRELPGVAEKLGCRVRTLRAAVNAARGNGAALGQGRPLDLPEPEPWPEPVDGAELLDELSAIRRYVVLGAAEADAVALWVLAVHAFDAWYIFPRLFVSAPEPQCGKTTLLDVLGRLVPRKQMVEHITAASLFRTIEAAQPTLLLDEADAYVRENEDLRAIVNSGHRRDGSVIRTVGDNYEPRQFSTWAPVALAAIGHLPATIEDRSVIVRLRRRRPDEPIKSLRLNRTAGLDTLARKAARWAADNAATLPVADPAMPGELYNRAADNWFALFAIADAAGRGDRPRSRSRGGSYPQGRRSITSRRGCCYSPTCASFSQPSRAAPYSPRKFSTRCTSGTTALARVWPSQQTDIWAAGCRPSRSRSAFQPTRPSDAALILTRDIAASGSMTPSRATSPSAIGHTVANEGFCGSRRFCIGHVGTECDRYDSQKREHFSRL